MTGTSTSRVPVEGASQSYWQSEGLNQKPDVQVLNEVSQLPDNCDVAIIGGGYAGIATAYHLLTSISPPPSVVLLEARQQCSGASVRNGGHLRPDYLMAAASNLKKYTAAAAAEIVKFEVNHLDAIKSLIQSEGIECDFRETNSYGVFTTSEQVSAAREMYDTLRRAPSFDDAILDYVDFYTGDEAPQRTGLHEAKGYFSTPAAHLSPYKLLMALLARCMELGLYLKTHTAVLSIDPSGQAGQTITTHSGETVTARQVVLATNAYTSALLPEYSSAIVPCKGQVCHITGPEGKALPSLPSTSFAIMEQDPSSNATGYNYLIQLADNSIVVGGAHHKYDEDDLGSWYNNVDDSQPISPAQRYFEEDYCQRTFLGWKDSQARVIQAWSGIMGYSADSLPHVGKVPNRDGVFVIAGFHGHGMPVIFLAARGIAAMVGNGTEYERTGLPSLYKTSQDRLDSESNDILAGRGIRSTRK
ncbi:MAG: hypothetical protein Q9187_000510 [Circinaria calcarea]